MANKKRRRKKNLPLKMFLKQTVKTGPFNVVVKTEPIETETFYMYTLTGLTDEQIRLFLKHFLNDNKQS